MKRIPKAFTMGAHRIEVKVISEVEMTARSADAPTGLCDFAGSVIYVQKARKGFPKGMQMHTFWHEYFHMLFYLVGRDRLARDETLVDNCGGTHLQAMLTAEF